MKYFLDFEFVTINDNDSYSGSIKLVPLSIGVAAEDGREYYGIFKPNPSFYRHCAIGYYGEFIQEVIYPIIQKDMDSGIIPKDCEVIADEVWGFMYDIPEFCMDCGSFDYVLLSNLMGGFERWCDEWPYTFTELNYIPSFNLEYNAIKDSGDFTQHRAIDDAKMSFLAYKNLLLKQNIPNYGHFTI